MCLNYFWTTQKSVPYLHKRTRNVVREFSLVYLHWNGFWCGGNLQQASIVDAYLGSASALLASAHSDMDQGAQRSFASWFSLRSCSRGPFWEQVYSESYTLIFQWPFTFSFFDVSCNITIKQSAIKTHLAKARAATHILFPQALECKTCLKKTEQCVILGGILRLNLVKATICRGSQWQYPSQYAGTLCVPSLVPE